MSEQPPQIVNERPTAVLREALRTPRAAAVAGIIFTILFTVSIVIIRLAIPEQVTGTATPSWLQEDTSAVSLALALVPFAGIAFLWFMGVVRDRLGDLEDQFFSTVFVGSGLLFIAMMFSAVAVASGVISAYHLAAGALDESGIATFGSATVYTIMRVYAIRMAGVFMISLGTIWYRTRLMPRPFVFVTYILAAIMLLALSASPWLILVLPGWVFAISLYILILSFRRDTPEVKADLNQI